MFASALYAFVSLAACAVFVAGLHAEHAARRERENNPRIRVRLIHIEAGELFNRRKGF